jgi:hypothetical protein
MVRLVEEYSGVRQLIGEDLLSTVQSGDGA